MAKLFADSDLATTEAAIRDLFRRLGGNVPIHELADAVIEQGVLNDEELDRITRRGVMERCRHALSHETKEGVPYAQPVRGGKRAPWIQLDLYTADQMASLLNRRADGIGDDCAKWWRLYTWASAKYPEPFHVPGHIQRWHDDVVNDDGDIEYRERDEDEDEDEGD